MGKRPVVAALPDDKEGKQEMVKQTFIHDVLPTKKNCNEGYRHCNEGYRHIYSYLKLIMYVFSNISKKY